ncbi:MAG TPA: helix-turn-helix domain-containing protein [Chryseolinea sp.]
MFVLKLPMHFVVYLPASFYSAMAATIVELLQVINEVNPRASLTYEFVSGTPQAQSRSGLSFPSSTKAKRKADVFVLLAGLGSGINADISQLEEEARKAAPYIKKAQQQGAVIAATCAASYFLAHAGLLNGKRATISWWLKRKAQSKFSAVKWEPSRILIRQGRLYTSGGGFSGLELISAVLIDIGFAKEEREARRYLVLPPARTSQAPYDGSEADDNPSPFLKKLTRISDEHLPNLTLGSLAKILAVSSRSLSRKFAEELSMTPGKWIQQERIAKASELLKKGRLSVSEVCYAVGYEDLPSFSRLFAKTTGMSPSEFRRHR